MKYVHKIGGTVFAVALLASVVIPAFAENRGMASLGMTGTSTRQEMEKEHMMRITASSTEARMERQEKAQAKDAANQCLRNAEKAVNQIFKTAMEKAQGDYKAAMMAARQAMLDAKEKARTNMMAARLAARTQCGIPTQTGSSTSPTH